MKFELELAYYVCRECLENLVMNCMKIFKFVSIKFLKNENE